MDDEAKADLQNILLPYATVATPNIPEAEEIVGFKINSEADIYKAGKLFIEEIGSKGVVIKGGHSTDLTTAKDYLFTTEDVLRSIHLVMKQSIHMVQVVHFQQLLQQN